MVYKSLAENNRLNQLRFACNPIQVKLSVSGQSIFDSFDIFLAMKTCQSRIILKLPKEHSEMTGHG